MKELSPEVQAEIAKAKNKNTNLKLEVGKLYRNRIGDKVICVDIVTDSSKEVHKEYPVKIYNFKTKMLYSKTQEGKTLANQPSNGDIVSEWKEPRSLKYWGHVIEDEEGNPFFSPPIWGENQLKKVGEGYYGGVVIDHYCAEWTESDGVPNVRKAC